MTVDSIIQVILTSRRDLTREEVLRMIEGKVKSAKGYFTDEMAARIVASELGIKIPQNWLLEILIKNLVSGLNDVTVAGRVISISSSQRFISADEAEGLIKRLLIADKSGVVKVVLWNDKAKLADDLGVRPGNIVRFSHGYVREGLNGRLELNMGTRGEIELLREEEIEDRYPPLEGFIKKIGEITKKDESVNVRGVVQQIFPESSFKKKDGSEGKVKRVWLRDSTGQTRVVFWNSKADEVEGLQKGNCLKIMNARVRSRIDGLLELHAEKGSMIEVSTKKILGTDFPLTTLTKVKEITQGMRDIDILARVTGVGEIRELNKQDAGYFTQLLLEDETGSIRINLWGDKALLSERIKLGDVVLVQGAYAKKRFEGISLNLDDKGLITISPNIEEAGSLPQPMERVVKIADIEEREFVTVQGTILTQPGAREVTTTRNEKVKVASFELSDETGKVEVSLWRRLAKAAEDLSIGDQIKIRNIYVRRNPSGGVSLSSGILTSLEGLSSKKKS